MEMSQKIPTVELGSCAHLKARSYWQKAVSRVAAGAFGSVPGGGGHGDVVEPVLHAYAPRKLWVTPGREYGGALTLKKSDLLVFGAFGLDPLRLVHVR